MGGGVAGQQRDHLVTPRYAQQKEQPVYVERAVEGDVGGSPTRGTVVMLIEKLPRRERDCDAGVAMRGGVFVELGGVAIQASAASSGA